MNVLRTVSNRNYPWLDAGGYDIDAILGLDRSKIRLDADVVWYRMQETNGRSTIEIDLPGVPPGDLSVTADDQQTLVISYKQHGAPVNRRLELREDFDARLTTARLELGVLTLSLTRRSTDVSKKVVIEVK